MSPPLRGSRRRLNQQHEATLLLVSSSSPERNVSLGVESLGLYNPIGLWLLAFTMLEIISGKENGSTLWKSGWVGTTLLVSGASSVGHPDTHLALGWGGGATNHTHTDMGIFLGAQLYQSKKCSCFRHWRRWVWNLKYADSSIFRTEIVPFLTFLAYYLLKSEGSVLCLSNKYN